jgi:hypothetical protein
MPSAKPLKLEDATPCCSAEAPQYFGPAVKYVQSPQGRCQLIDRPTVRTTQVSKSTLKPCRSETPALNGAPHWMTEALDNSTLLKEASKCSETPQEYRSGHCKSLGEVSVSDLKCNSSKLTRSESQKRPPSLQFVPML